MEKLLKILVAGCVLLAIGGVLILTAETPWTNGEGWPFLYQRAWDNLGGACFWAAIMLWTIGFRHWWRFELENETLGRALFAVIPALLLFGFGIGKVVADMIWCFVDGHLCHSREFVNGEIEKTVVNVGVCFLGCAWAVLSLLLRYLKHPDKRAKIGEFLLWWAIPTALLALLGTVDMQVALYLDDLMGEHWKYAFLLLDGSTGVTCCAFVMLPLYWVFWFKCGHARPRHILLRPGLVTWSVFQMLFAWIILEDFMRHV